MLIKDCAAIVTGGSSGLGADTARHLAAKGAKVTVIGTNIEKAERVAKEIGGLAIACDVSNAEAAAEAVKKAESIHGPARICINSAGVSPAYRIVCKDGPMPLDEFRKAVETNLIGTFNFLRLTAEPMSKLPPLNEDGERGVIINTSSISADEGHIGQTAYSASKSGILGLTLPAARELGHFGIRVVTINPGAMKTPMLEGFPKPLQENFANQSSFPKRLGKPSEFSKLVLHIIDNPFINGCILRLDGATRIHIPPNFAEKLSKEFLPD